MSNHSQEDYLMLSGIQHFAFCRRQWALIHIEQQWQENLRTVEGKILHENAHNREFTESRRGLITVRSLPVHSAAMGVSGECDVVEFQRDDSGGVPIFGREGKYRVCPIEYKRGKPKETEEDALQLAAQALCLEEMLCCSIPIGYLYYGETRHRLPVAIDAPLREKVTATFAEMHHYYDRRYTPKAKRTKACNACSMKNICLPSLEKRSSVKTYLQEHLTEETEREYG